MIAILSPASVVKEEYIEGAKLALEQAGYKVKIMPHAKGPSSGSYAASDDDRLADLISAWEDSEVKAILCARGGYGCNHLLERIPEAVVRDNAKWLIGFSDISALHALSSKAGVISVHGLMAKHLTEHGIEDESVKALLSIIGSEEALEYELPAHQLNVGGEAEGVLRGGNLAVINGLGGTPYDVLGKVGEEDTILFIEDISEAIYAVERMLLRMKMAGQLGKIKGMIVGAFTEYRADRNHTSMEQMISEVMKMVDPEGRIPVSFGFAAGHVERNLPLPMGAKVKINVPKWDNNNNIKGSLSVKWEA